MNSSTTVNDITLLNDTVVHSCDSKGNLFTSNTQDGYWVELTYDEHGKLLTYNE
jgi:YD repeat-containing protein